MTDDARRVYATYHRISRTIYAPGTDNKEAEDDEDDEDNRGSRSRPRALYNRTPSFRRLYFGGGDAGMWMRVVSRGGQDGWTYCRIIARILSVLFILHPPLAAGEDVGTNITDDGETSGVSSDNIVAVASAAAVRPVTKTTPGAPAGNGECHNVTVPGMCIYVCTYIKFIQFIIQFILNTSNRKLRIRRSIFRYISTNQIRLYQISIILMN